MAYWIDHRTPVTAGGTRTLSFMADSNADVPNLPTSITEGTGGVDATDNRPVGIGSDCICIADSSVFMLNSENQWVEV